MPPPPHHHRPDDTKQRANRCMIKLSDRDTEPMATSELESMAKSLPIESLPPFLSAISDIRTTDKTPLRRHSLRLLSVLSLSHPPSALLPLLPRMLSAALRRIRDPDSSVRSACVDAVRSIAASNPNSLSSTLLRPLSDTLLHEQDHYAQMASALCLAAAIDAAASTDDPDLTHHLQKILPRLVKLVRSNAFKAKPALVSLLGSVAGAGGASTPNLIGMLVPCLMEFLGSEDWAARKAAAEALARVGISDRYLLGGFKASCLSSFESRRFDKVKIVRESMNQMLEAWKDIPVDEDEDDSSNALLTSKPLPNSSRRDSSVQSASPLTVRKNKISVSRSPPPISTTRKKVSPKLHPPSTLKSNSSKDSDWKLEIAVSHALPSGVVCEEKPLKSKEGNVRSKFEARRLVFEINSENKASNKFGGGLKSASRVVPFEESGSSEVINESDIGNDVVHEDHKDSDLSLIRRQLFQIENQQSSLLDLLQRFIGSSQNGIHSLESRVHGLEMALDEISRDLTISTGRLSNSDPAVKTCCSLPGAEFLSPKFWRRTEGSRYSLSSNSTLAGMRLLAEQQAGEYYKPRGGAQNSFVVNPLAEINPRSRGNTEVTTNKMLKGGVHDIGIKHTHDG